MSDAKKKSSSSSKHQAFRPVKLTGKELLVGKRDEDGPLGWFLPLVESTYNQLGAAGASVTPLLATASVGGGIAKSSLHPGAGMTLAPAVATVWRDLLFEYKRRKAAGVAPAPVLMGGGVAPGAPFLPGGRNWLPLGPSIVLDGQTVDEQPVGGRVSGLAVAPGGQVVYAATANGGVFRSDDGATTWRSLMDGFDLDPTNFASASLVCGAVAIDPSSPNRVYVGTGEGDTLQLFRSRITNALPAYRGVGPIRSDDGGANWISEVSAPDLAGEAFFALAVDPADRENVVGATTQGLYQRVPRAGGQFEWVRQQAGTHCSVVATSSGGSTRFFAAQWGQGVFHSSDGQNWTPAGGGFPTNNVGRIALGAQADNTNLVYAFVADTDGAMHGIYRLDALNGTWKRVGKAPNVLPGKQGSYDLTIAVDPLDPNLIYLGGDRMSFDPYPGSIWRCIVKAAGTGYTITGSESIGTHAHADIHVLVHSPGDANELWCACDGGVFLNRNPRGSGRFASQNNGLSCLCSNFIAQHPTDPNLLFTGLQDNGTAWTPGGPIWHHVAGGDGGYCLVHWADPDLVLAFANGTVYRSTSGGKADDSWTKGWNFPWVTMTQPIVGTPYNPMSVGDAGIVAVGAGQFVFVSEDFADSWPPGLSFEVLGGPAAGNVFALAFASTTRLFVGTTQGRVFRADLSGGTWSLTRLDDSVAGPLGIPGLITDIAVDWGDPTLSSIYLAFGGMGDRRRVWWYDGSKWQERSGSAGGNSLLDVEHNALVVDRAAPNNLYAGADIGVWHSSDGGLNWNPLQNGLPDAPVFDLQIHPTQRLLRVATHGRGLYEIALG